MSERYLRIRFEQFWWNDGGTAFIPFGIGYDCGALLLIILSFGIEIDIHGRRWS
jgi:hypothetical protein